MKKRRKLEEEGILLESHKEHRLTPFLDYLNPDITSKKDLSPKKQLYFDLMSVAYHWRTSFYSPDQVRKLLMKEQGERSYSLACQIYADMEFIFGKSSIINKEATKRIQVESYYKLIQLIYKSNADEIEKTKRIESILSKIDKVLGLDSEENTDLKHIMPTSIIQIHASNGSQIAVLQKNE